MKICTLADTHGRHRRLTIPDCDLILFAGDMSNIGEEGIIEDFNEWIGELGIPTIAIAGNHDLTLERYPVETAALLTNMTYLRDEATEFEGLKIYGSPMARKIGGWAFGYKGVTEAMHYWNQIPENTDILLIHGPPEGILDKGGYEMEHLGCPYLLARIGVVKPRLVVYGHIHESNGIYHGYTPPTTYVNASICDWPNQDHLRKPRVIKI
jgi:Icc-related predicted phosphoesterase